MRPVTNWVSVVLDLPLGGPFDYRATTAVAVGDRVDELQIDAVVIGSGCGGGVIASELINAGFNVLVLEKGGFFQTEDFASEGDLHHYTYTSLQTSKLPSR
jgi:hypothetical protein